MKIALGVLNWVKMIEWLRRLSSNQLELQCEALMEYFKGDSYEGLREIEDVAKRDHKVVKSVNNRVQWKINREPWMNESEVNL